MPVATTAILKIASLLLSSKTVVTIPVSPVLLKVAIVSISSRANVNVIQTVSRTYVQSLNLIARAVINPYGVPPALDCECPPWVVNPNPINTWDISGDPCVVTTSGEYDLPYTLPVFRLHILGESLSVETHIGYDRDGGLTCTVSKTQTLSNNAIVSATLPKQFGRRGCE